MKTFRICNKQMEFAKTKRSSVIRKFLLSEVRANAPNLIQDTVEGFKISRQSVHNHLSQLVKAGFLIPEGNTRSRKYKLGPNRLHSALFKLDGLQESDVYYREFGHIFRDLDKELENICHYGFTEILNNAIDHSSGAQVFVSVKRTEEEICIIIEDDGIGIFHHIAKVMNLSDPREAILELSKGKLTTDPQRHTGQGIFFTSRAFDSFMIVSRDLHFSHEGINEPDILFHEDEDREGTFVMMSISMNSIRKLKDIFDEYCGGEDNDDCSFVKTLVPLRLALFEGGNLISRSQAKRILNRVEKFKYVILDFTDIEFVGQAFLDEIFRVFANNHPEISLMPCNTTHIIDNMIKTARINT